MVFYTVGGLGKGIQWVGGFNSFVFHHHPYNVISFLIQQVSTVIFE